MFAYCNNNPVMLTDSSGSRPIASTSTRAETKAERSAACAYMTALAQAAAPEIVPMPEPPPTVPTPYERWEEKGVSFVPSATGDGGQIKNSYLITDGREMTEYARYLMYESEYSSFFAGSLEGFVFEWDVHNAAYFLLKNSGNTKDIERTQHADIGRTIYSDNHRFLGKAMIVAFSLLYPEQAQKDHVIHIGG